MAVAGAAKCAPVRVAVRPSVVAAMRVTARVTFSRALTPSSIESTSNCVPLSGSSKCDGPSPWPLPSVAMSTSPVQPAAVEPGIASSTLIVP